jgi:hypothetical protein
MGIPDLLNDKRFNIFFSFVVGIGLVCVFRPMCTGNDCNINKAPTDKDFEKYVYKLGGGKCYEFKSEVVECPSSGTIEAFRECSANKTKEPFQDQFSRRDTPIKRCE